jgi:hypothetical protein
MTQATGANIIAAVMATGSVRTYRVLSNHPRDDLSSTGGGGAAGSVRLRAGTAVHPRLERGGGSGGGTAAGVISER